MASELGSLEDLLSCFICTAEFEESGENIPRLLPCSHTLCESCIKNLFDCGTVRCPFDNTLHIAKYKEKSFSQNKYILYQMKRKSAEEKQRKNKCEEHGKELSLFCKERACQTPICVTCLRRHHRKHDFVEIGEEMDALLEDIGRVQTNLQEKRKVLLNLREDVQEKTESCVTALNRKKIEIRMKVNEYFEEMTDEATNMKDEVNYQIDRVVEDINENMVILESIKQDRGQNGNIGELVEIFKNIHEHNKDDLGGTRTFHFPQYEPSFLTSLIKKYTGSITKQEVVAKFPEVTEDLTTLQLQSESEPESEPEPEQEPEPEPEPEPELEPEPEPEPESEPESEPGPEPEPEPESESEPEPGFLRKYEPQPDLSSSRCVLKPDPSSMKYDLQPGPSSRRYDLQPEPKPKYEFLRKYEPDPELGLDYLADRPSLEHALLRGLKPEGEKSKELVFTGIAFSFRFFL